MLTINAVDENGQPIRVTNPQHVEVYIGAMDAYEHYDSGGVRWKFPTAMMSELVAAFLEKYPNGIPKEMIVEAT